ncbi:MAG: hypothetical protein AB7T10_05820 [bacterium]
MKILIVLFSLPFIVLLAAENWQLTDIVDIGRGEKIINRSEVLTNLGSFDIQSQNAQIFSFNGNTKAISSEDDLMFSLYFDGRVNVYSLEGDSVKILYTISSLAGAEDIKFSKNILLASFKNCSKLLRIDTFSFENISGFNQSNVLSMAVKDSAVVSMKNMGEILSFGFISGGRYHQTNFIETENASFVFVNDFGVFVANSSGNTLEFYSINNDSISRLSANPVSKSFISSFCLDTIFALATDDSVFIIQFTDSVNFTYIDSIYAGGKTKDVIISGDSIYVLSETNVTSKEIHASSASTIGFSKNILNVCSDSSSYMLFSQDTLFILNDSLSFLHEKTGFLFQRDLYAVYDDSTILICEGDSFKTIQSLFIPSSAARFVDSLCLSSKEGAIASCGTDGSNFKVNALLGVPVYDICSYNGQLKAASGFYGLCVPDSLSLLFRVFSGEGLINEVKSAGGELYIGVEREMVMKTDSLLTSLDTFYNGDYRRMKNEKNLLLIVTPDSLILIDSTMASVAPPLKEYSGIVDASICDTTAVLVFSGGAVLLLTRNLTLKKEDPVKKNEKPYAILESMSYIDSSGRKTGSNKKNLKNGVYFLYDSRSNKITKQLILK